MRTEEKCRWVEYKVKCNSFFEECNSQEPNELPNSCSFIRLSNKQSCSLQKDDFPTKGIVNTSTTGLNLRSKPAYSNDQLKNTKVVTLMEKEAEVTIKGITKKEGTINGREGKWLELEYIDEEDKKHKGYAWCWNIALVE